MDFKGINKSILNKKALTFLKENSKVCQDYYLDSAFNYKSIKALQPFDFIPPTQIGKIERKPLYV